MILNEKAILEAKDITEWKPEDYECICRLWNHVMLNEAFTPLPSDIDGSLSTEDAIAKDVDETPESPKDPIFDVANKKDIPSTDVTTRDSNYHSFYRRHTIDYHRKEKHNWNRSKGNWRRM